LIFIIGPCFPIRPPGLFALLLAAVRHWLGRHAKLLRKPPVRHEKAAQAEPRPAATHFPSGLSRRSASSARKHSSSPQEEAHA